MCVTMLEQVYMDDNLFFIQTSLFYLTSNFFITYQLNANQTVQQAELIALAEYQRYWTNVLMYMTVPLES